MRSLTSTSLLVATAATMGLAGVAAGQTVIDGGHWDFETAYVNGEWEPHWHNHTTDTEVDFADAVLTGNFDGDATGFLAGIDDATPRPAGSQWDFTGAAAGEDLFVFPASDPQPELVYLGTAAEEVDTDIFVGDTITLEFVGIISAPTGGSFSKYGFVGGQPRAYFSSEGDNFTFADNTIQLNAGSHQHFNWAFTQPGVYELAFNASGTLAADNAFTESGQFTATFNIVPEPASLGLLGFAGLTLIRRRR